MNHQCFHIYSPADMNIGQWNTHPDLHIQRRNQMTKDNIVAACGKTLYGKNEKKDVEF